MKKILFLLLLSSFAFGQISQSTIEDIAKLHFEKEFVPKNFKDPYSYELKKIWSEPITKEMNTQDNIYINQMISENKQLPKKMRTEASEKIFLQKESLRKMSTNERNEIVAYNVCFDTYGANSYGNKILGRYSLLVETNGTSIGKVTERKE